MENMKKWHGRFELFFICSIFLMVIDIFILLGITMNIISNAIPIVVTDLPIANFLMVILFLLVTICIFSIISGLVLGHSIRKIGGTNV